LEQANRIDVIVHNERTAMITDSGKIREVLTFINRHEDGWMQAWTGPLAPSLDFFFYRDDVFLGEFGIAPNYIVFGGFSQRAPPDEISTLAQRLGLRWPPAW